MRYRLIQDNDGHWSEVNGPHTVTFESWSEE